MPEIDICRGLERVAEEMICRYQREGALRDWGEMAMFGSHTKSGFKEIVRELLMNNYRVKGGYRTTSIRGYHSNYIFYKER